MGTPDSSHLDRYRWKRGAASPNPAGRPKGSRSKLQELAVALLHADFAEHGEEVIRRVREKKPEVYLASVVALIPKQTEKVTSPLVDISDDELAQLEEHLAFLRAKTVEALGEPPSAPQSSSEAPTARAAGARG